MVLKHDQRGDAQQTRQKLLWQAQRREEEEQLAARLCGAKVARVLPPRAHPRYKLAGVTQKAERVEADGEPDPSSVALRLHVAGGGHEFDLIGRWDACKERRASHARVHQHPKHLRHREYAL
eukprot:7386169-Prymnesium_polylepis.1